jgi:hypothetical protein
MVFGPGKQAVIKYWGQVKRIIDETCGLFLISCDDYEKA